MDADIDVSASSIDPVVSKIKVRSKNLDLDQLLTKNTTAKSSGGRTSSGGASQSQSSTKSSQPSLDKTLAELGQNPSFKTSRVNFDVGVQKFRGYGFDLTNLLANGSLAGGKINLSRLNWQGYQGKGSFSGLLDLTRSKPSYKGKVNISNVNFEPLIKQISPGYSKSVEGIFFQKANFSGQSLDGDAMIRGMKLNGDFSINQGVLKTIDVVKMTNSAINSGIKKVVQNFPWFKIAEKSWIKNDDSRYEFLRGNFNLVNGVLRSKVFNAKSERGKGVDIEGNTSINLLNNDLKAKWFVVDTYNHTKLKDVSADYKGFSIKNILVSRNGKAKLPISIGCKLTKPCYDFGEVPKYFIGNVTANLKNQVKSRINKRVQKEKKKLIKTLKKKTNSVTKEIGGKAKKEVEKALKRFGF